MIFSLNGRPMPRILCSLRKEARYFVGPWLTFPRSILSCVALVKKLLTLSSVFWSSDSVTNLIDGWLFLEANVVINLVYFNVLFRAGIWDVTVLCHDSCGSFFLKIMKIVFDFISISLLLYPFQGNLIGSWWFFLLKEINHFAHVEFKMHPWSKLMLLLILKMLRRTDAFIGIC
jgi:hypothetical protein